MRGERREERGEESKERRKSVRNTSADSGIVGDEEQETEE